MVIISNIANELIIQIARMITGRLFTKEQIDQITRHSLGRYLEEVFPKDGDRVRRGERLDEAKQNIATASTIISEMRIELDAQTETLRQLVEEIEQKKSVDQRYAALAQTNQQAASAMRMEIEETIRQELIRQSESNKNIRRISSIILWAVTIILGAAVGAYFKDIVDWIKIA